MLFLIRRFVGQFFPIVYEIVIFIVGCAFIISFKVKKHPFRHIIDEDLDIEERTYINK